MNTLIACCGLDCEQCDARRATINNDNALREITAKKWRELNNAPQITAEMIHCMVCRTGGVKFAYCSDYCPIRKCVSTKGFKTCAECAEMESCQMAGAIFRNNHTARENLFCVAQ